MAALAAKVAVVRRRIVLPSLIAFAALLSPAAAQAQDDWLGRDKALHFTFSAAIAGGGYALSVPLTDDRAWRVTIGAGLGLSAGVAKELYDAAGYGDPSYRDLVWDAVGVATGVGLAYLIDRLVQPGRDERAATGAAPAPALVRLRF